MKFFPLKAQPVEAISEQPTDAETVAAVGEKTPSETDSEGLDGEAQHGVQAMEATTSVWTKQHLIIAYIFIWIITFINTLLSGLTGALTPYVTSSFNEHSLTATTSVMSYLIGGLFTLYLAKILDIFGRPQGYALMILIKTIGAIMMATCQNVETYAAAQVFHAIGLNGISFSLAIFVADTSKLKTRGLMYGFTSSPYLITTWISGPFAQAMIDGPGFRVGFWIATVLVPVFNLPLLGLFYWNYRKAKKAGLMPVAESGRSPLQSLKYYLIEFDFVGVLMVVAGLALFLLPFNIVTRYEDGWKSPAIICMLVIGILLVIAFGFWERFGAKVNFIPFHLMKDRTVIGACLLAMASFVEFYIWNSYFPSYLQVVNNLSITTATYVGNIYTMGSCLSSILVGFAILWSGRFRWITLYFGVPITMLGIGLMIAFRQPDVNIGYLIMCQIFIAFGGGAIVIGEQTAAMAATSHKYVATILAVLSMCSYIGGAIGSTVAAAIWQAVFPKKLLEFLPESAQGNFTVIYGDIVTQLSYEVGTPERHAINKAYGEAQRIMLIAATCVTVIGLTGTFMWRDINVKKHQQVKGVVI